MCSSGTRCVRVPNGVLMEGRSETSGDMAGGGEA